MTDEKKEYDWIDDPFKEENQENTLPFQENKMRLSSRSKLAIVLCTLLFLILLLVVCILVVSEIFAMFRGHINPLWF